jgi:ABC-2 type transport system permease protein
MNAAVRAEWRKLRTSRAATLMLAAGLAYAVLNGIATAALAGRDANAALGTAANLANIVRGGNIAMWVMLLVGTVTITGEYRHRTVTTTFLATPRRGTVVGAKLAVAGGVAALYAIVTMAVGLLAALPRLVGSSASIELGDSHVAQVVAGTAVGTTLFALAGVGIGALVRNQTLAVAGALIWFVVAENIVGSVVGWDVGRWLPGRAAAAASAAGGGTLLPMAAGAGLFAAYTAVVTVAGARLAVARDVT